MVAHRLALKFTLGTHATEEIAGRRGGCSVPDFRTSRLGSHTGSARLANRSYGAHQAVFPSKKWLVLNPLISPFSGRFLLTAGTSALSIPIESKSAHR
jgi:hypothetical protein